jgi:hypothetical protein
LNTLKHALCMTTGDCDVDEHMTDEQIDFELFEKEAAKD